MLTKVDLCFHVSVCGLQLSLSMFAMNSEELRRVWVKERYFSKVGVLNV